MSAHEMKLSLFLSLCHVHTLQLHITTDEEAAASKRMVFYDFYVFQRKKTIFIKFIYLTNFALHSFLFVLLCEVLDSRVFLTIIL